MADWEALVYNGNKMTIVDKGIICDICGEMIYENKIQPIEILGIPLIFHIHKLTPSYKGEICRDVLLRAAKEKNWNLLPDCFLKEAYSGMIKAQALLNIAEKEGGEKEALRIAAEILKNV